jgi:hypothetical protein
MIDAKQRAALSWCARCHVAQPRAALRALCVRLRLAGSDAAAACARHLRSPPASCLALLLLLGVCDARVLQQSPAQHSDAKQATSAKDALPLLALLIIPGFCLLQMYLDCCTARRKRAREAKHAEAEESFGAGGSADKAAAPPETAAKAAPPHAAAAHAADGASGSTPTATEKQQGDLVAPPPDG